MTVAMATKDVWMFHTQKDISCYTGLANWFLCSLSFPSVFDLESSTYHKPNHRYVGADETCQIDIWPKTNFPDTPCSASLPIQKATRCSEKMRQTLCCANIREIVNSINQTGHAIKCRLELR